MTLLGFDHVVVGDPAANRVYVVRSSEFEESGGQAEFTPSIVIGPPLAPDPEINVEVPRGFGKTLFVTDIDGDAVLDLVVGAPESDVRSGTTTPPILLSGAVYFFSGARLEAELLPLAAVPVATPAAVEDKSLLVQDSSGGTVTYHTKVGTTANEEFGHAIIEVPEGSGGPSTPGVLVVSSPGACGGNGRITTYKSFGPGVLWGGLTAVATRDFQSACTPLGGTGNEPPRFGETMLVFREVSLTGFVGTSFLVSAPGADEAGLVDAGRVTEFHVADASSPGGVNVSIRQGVIIRGTSSGGRTGRAMSVSSNFGAPSGSDLIAIGAPGAMVTPAGQSPVPAGRVFFRDPTDLTQPSGIADLTGTQAGEQFGWSMVSLSSAPGEFDLAIGAPEGDLPGGCGRVDRYRLSGITGSGATATAVCERIYSVHGSDPDGRYGESLVLAPDLNGGGQQDLLAGAPGHDLGVGQVGGVEAILEENRWPGRAGSDLELRIALDPIGSALSGLATGPGLAQVQAAPSGAGWILRLDLKSPAGTRDGLPLILAVQTVPSPAALSEPLGFPGVYGQTGVGACPPVGIPGLEWLGCITFVPQPNAALQLAISPQAGPLSFFVPASFAGTSLAIQGVTYQGQVTTSTYFTTSLNVISF